MADENAKSKATIKAKTKTKTRAKAKPKGLNFTYRLRITLMSGLGRHYKGIYRDIEMGAESTLVDLHNVIFELFERYDECLWEFIFGAKTPLSRGTMHLGSNGVHFIPLEIIFSGEMDKFNPVNVTLDQLNLVEKEIFFYWFDFGDDWIHRIRIMRIDENASRDPDWVLIRSVGASPEQYPSYEDEEDGEDAGGNGDGNGEKK